MSSVKKTKDIVVFWQFMSMEYLAYLVIIIVPLFVMRNNLFGFTSPKSFLALGIVAVMTILYVWGKYREIQKGKGGMRITWLHVVLVIFALVLGVSAVCGVDPHTSWFGTFQQGTGLIYIYTFILWSLLIGSLVRRTVLFLPRFLSVALATGVISIALSVFGHSTIGNSSFEGTYLLFIACMGLGLFMYYHILWQRILVGIGVLVVLFSPTLFNETVWKGKLSISSLVHNPLLLVGEANGAALGLGIAILMMLGLFATRSKLQYRRVLGCIACAAVLGAVVIAGYQLLTPGTTINERFITEKTATRFVYWDIAQAGTIEYPLTGYGWGNYGAVFQEYFDPIVFSAGYAIEPSLQEPHNIIWSYASTTGVLGLSIYLLLIGSVFVVFYLVSGSDDRYKKLFGITLGTSIVGYFLQNMFIFDTPVIYLLFFSVVGIAIGFAPVRWSISLHHRYGIIYGVAAILIGAMSIAGAIIFAIMPWRESREWTRRIVDNNDISASSPQVVSVVGGVNDTAYIAIKFYIKAKEHANSEIEKALYSKKFSLLIDDLRYDIIRHQDNYKAYLVKGILENGIILFSGKPDAVLLQSARIDLERAIALNPRTPEPYFNLVRTAVYERHFNNAYANLRAGIALAPTYWQGHEIGNALLKISPNKAFEQYLISIQK